MFKSKLNQGDKSLWHGNHKTLYQKKKAKKTSKWEDSPCPQIGKFNSKMSLFPKVTYGFIGISIKIPMPHLSPKIHNELQGQTMKKGNSKVREL